MTDEYEARQEAAWARVEAKLDRLIAQVQALSDQIRALTRALQLDGDGEPEAPRAEPAAAGGGGAGPRRSEQVSREADDLLQALGKLDRLLPN